MKLSHLLKRVRPEGAFNWDQGVRIEVCRGASERFFLSSSAPPAVQYQSPKSLDHPLLYASFDRSMKKQGNDIST